MTLMVIFPLRSQCRHSRDDFFMNWLCDDILPKRSVPRRFGLARSPCRICNALIETCLRAMRGCFKKIWEGQSSAFFKGRLAEHSIGTQRTLRDQKRTFE